MKHSNVPPHMSVNLQQQHILIAIAPASTTTNTAK